jgi:outer membrane protein TolC
VVQHVLESDERTLDLVRHARAAGVVSDIDVLSATGQRDSDRTLLPLLRQQLNVARMPWPCSSAALRPRGQRRISRWSG